MIFWAKRSVKSQILYSFRSYRSGKRIFCWDEIFLLRWIFCLHFTCTLFHYSSFGNINRIGFVVDSILRPIFHCSLINDEIFRFVAAFFPPIFVLFGYSFILLILNSAFEWICLLAQERFLIKNFTNQNSLAVALLSCLYFCSRPSKLFLSPQNFASP